MKDLEPIILDVLEKGFGLSLNWTKDDSHWYVTWKIRTPSGEGFGRGTKLDSAGQVFLPADILKDSIDKTIAWLHKERPDAFIKSEDKMDPFMRSKEEMPTHG